MSTTDNRLPVLAANAAYTVDLTGETVPTDKEITLSVKLSTETFELVIGRHDHPPEIYLSPPEGRDGRCAGYIIVRMDDTVLQTRCAKCLTLVATDTGRTLLRLDATATKKQLTRDRFTLEIVYSNGVVELGIAHNSTDLLGVHRNAEAGATDSPYVSVNLTEPGFVLELAAASALRKALSIMLLGENEDNARRNAKLLAERLSSRVHPYWDMLYLNAPGYPLERRRDPQ